jgi:hypothetical protein
LSGADRRVKVHLMVRSFAEEIHEQLVCIGQVQDGSFVLHVNGAPFRLPTAAIGHDESGEFALLQ